MLEIEILRNKECKVWKKLFQDLKNWLRMWGLNGKTKIKVTLISTDEEARKRKFFGSPQLIINGQDIDPSSNNYRIYHSDGCRIYNWRGKIYEYPPREMVEEFILRIEQLCLPQRIKTQK
jgi:hypothetical protein